MMISKRCIIMGVCLLSCGMTRNIVSMNPHNYFSTNQSAYILTGSQTIDTCALFLNVYSLTVITAKLLGNNPPHPKGHAVCLVIALAKDAALTHTQRGKQFAEKNPKFAILSSLGLAVVGAIYDNHKSYRRDPADPDWYNFS